MRLMGWRDGLTHTGCANEQTGNQGKGNRAFYQGVGSKTQIRQLGWLISGKGCVNGVFGIAANQNLRLYRKIKEGSLPERE